MLLPVRDKHIAQPPHRLHIARIGWILAEKFAQSRHLHIDGAIKRIVFTTACELGEFVARQRQSRVFDQHFQQAEFAGRHG